MFTGDKFEYVDPLGMLEGAEKAEKTGYEPSNTEGQAIREIIKEEAFTAHCGQLQQQRAFLQKKGVSEAGIVKELWKRLTYK